MGYYLDWYRRLICQAEGHTHGEAGQLDCILTRLAQVRATEDATLPVAPAHASRSRRLRVSGGELRQRQGFVWESARQDREAFPSRRGRDGQACEATGQGLRLVARGQFQEDRDEVLLPSLGPAGHGFDDVRREARPYRGFPECDRCKGRFWPRVGSTQIMGFTGSERIGRSDQDSAHLQGAIGVE